eukprot:6847199-Prymnesium_polylepis.1
MLCVAVGPATSVMLAQPRCSERMPKSSSQSVAVTPSTTQWHTGCPVSLSNVQCFVQPPVSDTQFCAGDGQNTALSGGRFGAHVRVVARMPATLCVRPSPVRIDGHHSLVLGAARFDCATLHRHREQVVGLHLSHALALAWLREPPE